MLEKTLYKPLVAGGLIAGWALYRIEDGGYGRKPCDIAGWTPSGRGVCLEVKVVERQPLGGEKLPWRQFETHQIGWLIKAKTLHAVGLVGLYSETDEAMWLYRFAGLDEVAGDLVRVELRRVKNTTGTEHYHGLWGRLED